jgi:fumarylacetoacetate (FAA) hydrolase
MKLGSLRHPEKRDGELIVVSRDNSKGLKVPEIAGSLREAFDTWSACKPKLKEAFDQLQAGEAANAFDINPCEMHSPMPRAFQWADGSAFIHHIRLVRMARNAPMPEGLETTPLMYQGGSDSFLAPLDSIPQIDFSHGTDFEGEVGVIVGDVPMGVSAEKALEHVELLVIINDVSLRGLIPDELKAGFGFFQGKPSSAFAPFAVTPDELGDAWKDGRIHLPLKVELNGEFFGKANAKEMHFHFGELIAHAARTRHLSAGTLIGSGTVSNENREMGSSCLAEKRMLEKIDEGAIKTPFMKVGDKVKIEMFSESGENIFGTIEQEVVKYEPPS